MDTWQVLALGQHLVNVGTGTVDQHQNGFFSALRFAGNHGVQHRAVQRQRAGRAVFAGGGNLETGAQQRAQRPAHLHQHAVVAGADQALVKAQVGRDVVAPKLDGVFHARIGLLHIGNVGRQRTQRGKTHGSGLDHAAQVLQILQKIHRQTSLGLPDDHVGIEPVPLVFRLHPGAHLGAGGQQALGHQRLDRLADHRAADTQFLAQQRLGRDRLAHGIVATDDGFAEVIHRVPVYVFNHGFYRG